MRNATIRPQTLNSGLSWRCCQIGRGRHCSGLSRDFWLGAGQGHSQELSLNHSCVVLAVSWGLMNVLLESELKPSFTFWALGQVFTVGMMLGRWWAVPVSSTHDAQNWDSSVPISWKQTVWLLQSLGDSKQLSCHLLRRGFIWAAVVLVEVSPSPLSISGGQKDHHVLGLLC